LINGLYTNKHLYLTWVMLGLRKEADGSPSPPPEINEMGKQKSSDWQFTFYVCIMSLMSWH